VLGVGLVEVWSFSVKNLGTAPGKILGRPAHTAIAAGSVVLWVKKRVLRCRRDRPPPKPLCATAALIQARRARQLSSASQESSPSLDPRMDAA
jgi:hypothetical protein